MYSGLEWPSRFIGGEFRRFDPAQPESTLVGRDDCSSSLTVLFDDAAFRFHSSKEQLCGLQHKHVGDAFIAIWGTPIPKDSQDVLAEFQKAAHGEYGGLKFLGGSWSAIVYSTSTKQLRLINDFIGTRPILYFHDGVRFAFASDVCHLRAIGNVGTAVNPDVLASWIWYGYNVAPTGILVNARHMAPGSVLVAHPDGRHEETPYITKSDATRVGSREELIHCFERVIGRACEYALKSSPCVNVMLSGGWDSRYVLAHLLDRGGNKNNLRLTTVDHFGEGESARKVARVAGLELEVLPGTVYPDDSFDQPFNRTLEGLAFTKHATNIAAAHRPGMPAIQGYLGDSLVRGKNARRFNFNVDMPLQQQAAELADGHRSVPLGILREDVLQEIRNRSIKLTETILSSRMAGRPAATFDMYGRQRRYIVNNFLQHIEINEVYLPFCSWELVSHYLYADNHYLNEELYPEMFRKFYPEIGDVPRHKNVFRAGDCVCENAPAWARLSLQTLFSHNASGFFRKWRVIPRVAIAPFRSKQFYAIRAVAAISTQLQIISQLTNDRNLNLRSVLLD
jgi:hypothetical protein